MDRPHQNVFEQLVHSRRSIRRFLPDKIPKEDLDSALNLAILAPNSSNLQPWHFYVIQEKSQRENVAIACLSQKAAKTAPVLIIAVGKPSSWKRHSEKVLAYWPQSPVPAIVEKYYKKTVYSLYNSGFADILGWCKTGLAWARGLQKPIPRGPFIRSARKAWAGKSVALACGQLILAFRSQGYDSCAMEGFDEERLKQLLPMESGDFVVMVLAVGKAADGGIYHERFRFPFHDSVSYMDS